MTKGRASKLTCSQLTSFALPCFPSLAPPLLPFSALPAFPFALLASLGGMSGWGGPALPPGAWGRSPVRARRAPGPRGPRRPPWQ